MATKHEREASGNSTGLAEVVIAAVAKSRELGQGHVATIDDVAAMNAPARPAPRPGQPDLPADQLPSISGTPALDPLALKAYYSTASKNKHVASIAAKVHQLRDMGPAEKELRLQQ